MKFDDLDTGDDLLEARMVWRRTGNKIKRAVRCTSGPRKGRVVSDASQCGKPIDQKKRMQMRKTRASKGLGMARKARRTKKMNPAHKRLRQLNRS